MPELTWIVSPAEAPVPRTGGWRTGVKPAVDLSRCIDCLLCWVYCPDSAVALEGTAFAGFDYDVCKGCELCAEVCPQGAIEMVDE
jgi:2-oxoacid:acceptor oxidoreductase delta subunit (pyruvate/2-ketoisovalerate family)